MAGVSTAIWGPPLWRILHTIAFVHPDTLRAEAATVVLFLNNLAHVLPCKWCRTSYAQILRRLPSLETTLADGRLARWMYDLHTQVNTKLGAVTPKYDAVVKRFIVRPLQWSPADVWDTISLFGLNFTPPKRKVYRTFWDTFPTMLRLCGDVGADERIPDLLASVPFPSTDGGFIATCLVLEAVHQGHAPPWTSPAKVHARTRQYAAARASGGCKSGVCE